MMCTLFLAAIEETLVDTYRRFDANDKGCLKLSVRPSLATSPASHFPACRGFDA
jgi:hypothetical protein